MADMGLFERLANKAIEADLRAQEMLRNQEQQPLSNAAPQNSEEPNVSGAHGNAEGHVYRVHYYSIPQIIVKSYVQMGSKWCPLKKVKIAWEGRLNKYTKVIVAQNEEKARSMLRERAETDRSEEFRIRRKCVVHSDQRRSFNRVIVETTKWEVLI
jgi:hypothetical protein